MGCDGGTIPKRDELVRRKKKPEQKDKESELSFRWRHCAITQQPLQQPIVACSLGRLYCKESVLEGLLDRSKLTETAAHIITLKDVRELVLTPNPAYKQEVSGEKGEAGRYVDHRTSPYACPVIGLELSGKFRFAFPWNCGCVVSEKAIKEVPTKFCHKCQKPFEEEDLVYLNAEGEVLELMRTRMETRKVLAKANKKSKKNKQSTSTTDAPETSSTNGHIEQVEKSVPVVNIHESSNKDDLKQEVTVVIEAEKLPATACDIQEIVVKKEEENVPKVPAVKEKAPTEKESQRIVEVTEKKEIVTTKLTEENKESREARKRNYSSESKHHKEKRSSSSHKSSKEHRNHKSSHNHKSYRDEKFEKSSREHKSHKSKSGKLDSIADPAYKKAKIEYSVANDPKATSVYKSLFTSHEKAKCQTKAHWVTYNPFYN